MIVLTIKLVYSEIIRLSSVKILYETYINKCVNNFEIPIFFKNLENDIYIFDLNRVKFDFLQEFESAELRVQ